MSLMLTESFIAFGTYNGSDAYDPSAGGPNAARAAYALNLARAGYGVYSPANTSADTSGGLVVRADPIDPDQHALVQSSAVSAGVSLGVSAAFKKKLPITDKQIIIGFGIFVPTEYVANVSSSTVPVFRMNAGIDSDVNWQAVGITPIYSAKECFRVANDLSIRWGTDAAQSSKKLVVGAMNYMEVRIDNATVSVWIDDQFVMQKAVSLVPQSVAFIFENNINAGAGGTNMSGNPGRWAISNMYHMVNDGVSPTVRLGPTTRVVGQRPDTDIDVRFIRPVAAPTNASVAAQDLVDQPTQQLQSTTVGDYDTYQTVGGVSGAKITSMAMVHAVGIKVLAANLEPDIHKVKPFTKYQNSGEGADNKPRELSLFSGATNAPTRTIRAMAIRPTDHSVWAVGDGSSIYRSGANGDITTWTRVQDLGDATVYNGIYMRPEDGAILIGATNDNHVRRVQPGSNVLDATLGNLTAGAFPVSFARSPDGTRYIAYTALTTSSFAVYSADPWAVAPAWNNMALATTPANVGGFGQVAIDGTGKQVLTAGVAQDYVYTPLAATGATVNSRAHGDTGLLYNAVTFDGVAFLIGATISDTNINGGPRIRRSTDTISWSLVTSAGSTTPGATQQLRFGASNTANQLSIFGGDAGSLIISNDGTNWRQLPRLTAQALYAGVSLPNGDFLIAGGAATMLRYTSSGADTALQPLAGYTMAYGSAAINPKTGNPWTPAEAAAGYFGVRLTS